MRFVKCLKSSTHVLTFVVFGYVAGTFLSVPGLSPLGVVSMASAQDGGDTDSLMVDSALVDTPEVEIAEPPPPETPLDKAKKAVADDVTGDPSLRLELAMEHIKLQQYDEALDALKEAVSLDSNYVEANFWMARVYRDKGDKTNMYRQLIVVMESPRAEEFINDVKPFVGSSFEVTQITLGDHNDVAPSFSPDGSQILFQSDRDGSWDIYLMDVGSTGAYATRLTSSPAQEENPRFSADGKKVVYTSTEHASMDAELPSRELYVMNRDGTKVRRLTNSYNNDNWGATFFDSKTVVFASDRLDFDDVAAWKKKSDIFSIETNGKFLMEILVNEKFSYKDPAVDESGTYLIYASDKQGTYDLYTANLDGKNEKLLVQTPGDEIQPTFSKSGDFIAFASNQKGDYDIYRALPTGQEAERITTNLADDLFPSFSPDGTKIVYCSNSEGPFQLFMADLDAKTELTKEEIIARLKDKL